jgi:hypothetical protein
VDRDGRVRLYRVITNAELQSLAKHGDFNFAPSGGGKYFSFNRTDALKLGAKSPGGASAHTLVMTTVPRAFLPSRTDAAHKVNQPHLPARPGPASMIQGEVIIQVDRGGAGWALHVDDEALTAMNKVMSRPDIVSSPSTPTVTPPGGGGTPPAKPPDKPPPRDPPKPPTSSTTTKTKPTTTTNPATTGGQTTTTGHGRAPTPIQVPEPATRMHERRGTIGAGAMMLLGMQLNAIRGAEKQKAVKALEALTPAVEKHRSEGKYVTVTIEVEVPDQVDIAAIWAGIGDQSRVVYSKRMWISNASFPVKEPETLPADKDRPPPPRQPQRYRQNEATDQPREKEWYLNHPRKGFHFVTRDMHLPPTQQAKASGSMPATAIIFRPVDVQSNEPQNTFDDVGRHRLIVIDGDRGLHMWNTYFQRGYTRVDHQYSARDKYFPLRPKFENDAKDGRHTIESNFDWQQAKDGSWEIQEVAVFRSKEPPFYRSCSAGVRWVRD